MRYYGDCRYPDLKAEQPLVDDERPKPAKRKPASSRQPKRKYVEPTLLPKPKRKPKCSLKVKQSLCIHNETAEEAAERRKWIQRKRQKEKLARLQADPEDRKHGTITGYAYGCRCERCKAAGVRYRQEHKKRRNEG